MKASAAWLLAAAVFVPACWNPGGGRIGVTGDDRVPGADTVNVNVVCGTPAGVMHARVAPWRQQVGSGHQATWNLGGTGVAELTVTARDTTWPFQDSTRSGTPAVTSGPMKAHPVVGHPIPYTITVRCDSLTVVIDPELIIPGT